MGDEAFTLEFNALLRGRSDEDLSRLLKVSQPTIRRYKEGTTAPVPALRASMLAEMRKR